MVQPCFVERGPKTPVCGVHGVPLIRKQLPDEMKASGYKEFTFYVCPVSRKVLNDETPT